MPYPGEDQLIDYIQAVYVCLSACVGRQQPNYADYSKFKAIALELWVLKFDESAWIRASHGPEAAMQLMLQALLDDIFSPGAMYIYTYLIPNNKTLKEALEENPRRSHIAPPVLYGQRASPMKLTGGPAATLIGSRNPPENVHAKLRVFRSPDSEWQPDTSDCVPVQDDTGEPVEINNDGSEVDAARNSVSSFSPKSSADWTLSLPLASGEQNGVGRSSSLGQTLRHRFHERTSSILLQIEQGSKGAGSDMPDLEALVDKYIEEEAEFQEPASGDEGVHISAPPLVVRALAAALQRKRAILVTHAGDGPWITEHITRNLRGRCTNVVSSEAAAMGAQRLMPLQRFLTQVRAGQLAPASIVVQDAHLLRLDQTALDTQQALQTFFSRCPRVYLVTDAPMQSAAADMYELTRFVKGSRYVNKSFDEDVSGAETVDEVALASLVGTSTLASRSVYSIWRMSNFLGKPTVQERLVKEAQTQRVTFLEHLASHARANVAKLSMALNSDFDKKGVAQNLYKVASVVDQGNLNNFASIGHLENVRLAGEAASRRVESANEEWGEAKKFAALAMVMVAVTLVSFQISRLMRRSEEDVKAVLHECRAWVIAVPRAMPALRQLHIESKSVDMTWPQIKLWMDMMMDSAAGRSTPLTDLQSSIDMQHVSHMAVREDGTENVSTDAPKVHDLARALMTFVAESESKRALVISKFHKEGTERVKYALASLAAHVSQKDAADRITLVSLEDTVVEAGVLQRISEAVDGRDAEVHFLEPLGSHPAFARIVHMLESTRGDADVPMRVVQWQSASSHLKGALHTSASALQWMTDKIKWKYTLVPFWLRRGSDVSPDSMLSQEQDRMGRLYDFVRAELAVSSVSKCCIRQEDVQGQEFCANEAGKRDAPPCVVDAVVGGASGGQAVAPLAMLATVLVSVASSMG